MNVFVENGLKIVTRSIGNRALPIPIIAFPSQQRHRIVLIVERPEAPGGPRCRIQQRRIVPVEFRGDPTQGPECTDGRAAESQVNKKIHGGIRNHTADASFPDCIPQRTDVIAPGRFLTESDEPVIFLKPDAGTIVGECVEHRRTGPLPSIGLGGSIRGVLKPLQMRLQPRRQGSAHRFVGKCL